MDWSNERYVRYYSRDTVTFSTWPWQAQALLGPLMRKLDRAGVLDVGDHDPVDAVWSLYQRWPREVIEVGLAAMLKSGTLVYEGDRLLMPKYLEAQEAKQSGAQRQRESRARKRDLDAAGTVTKRDVVVTLRDEVSESESEPSHPVTPYRTVPSRTVPNQDPEVPNGTSSPRRSAARTVARRKKTSASDALPQRALPLDAEAEGTNGAKPKAADSRKRRAREVHTQYEQDRVGRLHGSRGQPRGFTEDDHKALVRLMRHVAKVEQCDESAAWEAVAEYGQLAITEAAAAMERGDDNAEKLVAWRRGPSAWRKSRYETVMSTVQAKRATTSGGGARKIKYDDELGYFYYLDKWKQRVRCDEEGKRVES